MTNAEGLMPKINRNKAATPVLDSIRAELSPPELTLEQEVARMSSSELLGVTTIVKLLQTIYDPDQKRDYDLHVATLQKKAPAKLKKLYADLMRELHPDLEYKPSVAEPTAALQSSSPSYKQQSDFMSKLMQSESSGDTEAEITIADGRKFTGALQFGAARLADFKQATGIRFTQEQFKADPVLQDEVAQWHIKDIDKAIDALGDTANDYNRDGLRSVAHLGGKSGMAKYVRSGGQYNPSDELGTSLSDYYNKFSS